MSLGVAEVKQIRVQEGKQCFLVTSGLMMGGSKGVVRPGAQLRLLGIRPVYDLPDKGDGFHVLSLDDQASCRAEHGSQSLRLGRCVLGRIVDNFLENRFCLGGFILRQQRPTHGHSGAHLVTDPRRFPHLFIIAHGGRILADGDSKSPTASQASR
jgi:hypothetical protein